MLLTSSTFQRSPQGPAQDQGLVRAMEELRRGRGRRGRGRVPQTPRGAGVGVDRAEERPQIDRVGPGGSGGHGQHRREESDQVPDRRGRAVREKEVHSADQRGSPGHEGQGQSGRQHSLQPRSSKCERLRI